MTSLGVETVVVRVEGRPLAKVGREYQESARLRQERATLDQNARLLQGTPRAAAGLTSRYEALNKRIEAAEAREKALAQEHTKLQDKKAVIRPEERPGLKVHIATLVVPDTKPGQPWMEVYIHAKLMIVDDDWVRIGSANLSSRSMALDTECDLVVESRGERRVAEAIRRFRERLLAEHLDTDPERVRKEVDKAGSLNGAIAAFAHQPRTLRQFDELPQWPEPILSVASVADPEEPIALETLLSERHAEEVAAPEKPAGGRLTGIVLGIVALAAMWRFTPLREVATAEAAVAWAKAFGAQPWAPWVLMASYTPACLVMFPRPLITLAAVIAFGPWLGFFYSLTGICVASAVTWYMGLHMRRDTVRRLAGPKLDRMIEVMRKRGLAAMTLLRLVPLAPFAVESIVAGAIRMKLWHVIVGTAIGLLPGTLTTTVFGDAIETAVTGSGSVNWWLVGAAAALLAAGAWAVKRWFTRMERRMRAHGQASRHPR